MVMKYLRFNFCHPVKVHANITQLLASKPQRYNVVVDSNENNLVEIPLTGYSEGKWKIMLDWKYEGQSFTHQKEFEIKKQGAVA
jgi:hypothetical protein